MNIKCEFCGVTINPMANTHSCLSNFNPPPIMLNNKPTWADDFESLWEASFDHDGEKNPFEFERLKDFIHQLPDKERQKVVEEVLEKLKHIAMVDNGKEPKYFVKDVLDLLGNLKDNKILKT